MFNTSCINTIKFGFHINESFWSQKLHDSCNKEIGRGGGVSYENALWIVWWFEKVDKQQIHMGGAKHL